MSKIVIRDLPPGALVLVRAGSATLILLLVHVLRRGAPRVPLRDLPLLALSALLGVSANQILFFEGFARS